MSELLKRFHAWGKQPATTDFYAVVWASCMLAVAVITLLALVVSR